MLRKKMGVKMSATGLIRSPIRSNCFVSDRMSPAANAPMMSAVPARSARTQSSSRNAKADTTITPRTRIRSTRPKSRGATFSPIHRATKRKATATPRMRSAPCRLNAVPAATAVPTRTMALRSAPSPISNNSTTTPTWASSRTPGVSGSSAPIGITLRKPAPSTIPARSSPMTAGCPRRSNASPANFPASSMIANTVKKRATSIPPPAAPSTRGRPAARAHVGRLKRLRRLGMEVEGVVEQRERDRLAVLGLDHDLPRRRPPCDADLLGLGRETDILRGGLDPAADRAVVEGGGKLGLGLHLVEQAIVPEEQLTDVDAVVQRPDQEEQRDEAAGGAGAAATAAGGLHHRSEERRVGKECRSRWSPYH